MAELLPFEIMPPPDCSYLGKYSFDIDLPTVGLDGILALTSFAYTNIGELSGLVVPFRASLRSDRDIPGEIEDSGPSLIILDALDLWPEVEILSPNPLEARTSCRGVPRFSMEEPGLELLGVPFDISFGVDNALSILAFLEPERGVILELRKVLTGVATSSGHCPFSMPDPSPRPSL